MILVVATFVVLMLMGMPLAFAIGMAGTVFFIQHPELPSTIPVQVTVSQTQNFALLAIPLFILAGNLMNGAGVSERLLNVASALTGRMRGGLAQVSVTLSALMGGVSGSAIADASMQARMLGDEMSRRGLPRPFAAAVLAFGAILTPIIPPGIGMILYGSIGQVSIGRLFAAGFVPAAMLWLGLALTIWLVALRRGFVPERSEGMPLRAHLAAWRGGALALLFPVLLLVGLRMGVFTPSEIGAFAVVYAAFLGFIVHRRLDRRSTAEALEGSLTDIGSVMFLIALSAIFSYGIVFERVPETIANAMIGLTDNLQLVMILIVLTVIAAGFFIDATVLIIMLTPIFLPLIRSLGGDPVHFGMVFIIAATIGNFTPPVGAAMYAVCSILKVPLGEYSREAVPMLIAVTLVVLAMIFLPGLVLFLPDLLFGR
ncbi:tripartite ATP-independent transporter DctM subunit [Tepidamorphus gemmatus]|jgi:tripartite ATP-independent transporter DctM subunit|uniref:TRAP transporter large permease protein n=1 Tax=Tepidamorphus gemmatus TaxID=747076 RepID=A0A4R3MFF8_9HYPH|nr:TRAP transporter large permease subunit [Tepidamorphus gemmatus]TCT12445.1 tripartite ATP-independent transporter DctM subunit [Tepidamorphus gemmatus]